MGRHLLQAQQIEAVGQSTQRVDQRLADRLHCRGIQRSIGRQNRGVVVGDAEVGDGSNVAAANVTANLGHVPGEPKKRTRIGSNVRTGVDNTFVAPVEIGDDSWIAPGAVITENVPPGSLAGFAPRQLTKEGWVYEEHGKSDGD